MPSPAVMQVLFLLLLSVQPAPDAEARVEGLLAAMGGRTAWASTSAVRVEAVHYVTQLRQPHRNEIWNDFRTLRLRIRASSDEIDRELIVDGTKGTRRDRDTVTALTTDQVAEQQRWWEGNIYRTLHRLARRDPELSVRMLGPNRLGVFRRDGVRLTWIELNGSNEPILVGSWDSEAGTVFGPLTTSPSGLKHSRWLTSADGTWRVELREIAVVEHVDLAAGAPAGGP